MTFIVTSTAAAGLEERETSNPPYVMSANGNRGTIFLYQNLKFKC